MSMHPVWTLPGATYKGHLEKEDATFCSSHVGFLFFCDSHHSNALVRGSPKHSTGCTKHNLYYKFGPLKSVSKQLETAIPMLVDLWS